MYESRKITRPRTATAYDWTLNHVMITLFLSTLPVRRSTFSKPKKCWRAAIVAADSR
jgi:hypothetical protein